MMATKAEKVICGETHNADFFGSNVGLKSDKVRVKRSEAVRDSVYTVSRTSLFLYMPLHNCRWRSGFEPNLITSLAHEMFSLLVGQSNPSAFVLCQSGWYYVTIGACRPSAKWVMPVFKTQQWPFVIKEEIPSWGPGVLFWKGKGCLKTWRVRLCQWSPIGLELAPLPSTNLYYRPAWPPFANHPRD